MDFSKQKFGAQIFWETPEILLFSKVVSVEEFYMLGEKWFLVYPIYQNSEHFSVIIYLTIKKIVVQFFDKFLLLLFRNIK